MIFVNVAMWCTHRKSMHLTTCLPLLNVPKCSTLHIVTLPHQWTLIPTTRTENNPLHESVSH